MRILHASYSSMLTQSQGDAALAQDAEAYRWCFPILRKAASFADDAHIDQPGAAGQGPAITAQLTQCRDRALRDEKAGDERTGRTGRLLRRFASVGMVLVGTATVAGGDRVRGMALRSAGIALVDKDRPGFKLNTASFLGR